MPSSRQNPGSWLVMDREGRLGALTIKAPTLVPRGALQLREPDPALDIDRAVAWLLTRHLFEDVEDDDDDTRALELPSGDEAAHFGVLTAGMPSAALVAAVEAGRLDPATAGTFVTRVRMPPAELRACLSGTTVLNWCSGEERHHFWEALHVWVQGEDRFTYRLDGDGHIGLDDLPPEWRATLSDVPRLAVDFSATRRFALADVCAADQLVLASPAGAADETAIRLRFAVHASAIREMREAALPDARFKSGEAPWVPDRLACDGRELLTEPLATWVPDAFTEISDWKDRRHYVDARDVTAETFRRHPAALLHERHARLRELVARMPIFALGRDSREHDRLRDLGARVYTVSFVRTADDGFDARMQGPGVSRGLRGPLRYIRDAAPSEHSRDREALIRRILTVLTDGRVDQRTIHVAEQWAALAGDEPRLQHSAEELAAQLDDLEASLEEVFARAQAQRSIAELILTSVRDAEAVGASGFELPWLGDAVFERRQAFELHAGGGIDIDIDGAPTLAVPAERGRILLDREPRSWLPEAERRRRAQPLPVQPAPRDRTGCLILLAGLAVVLFLGLVVALTRT